MGFCVRFNFFLTFPSHFQNEILHRMALGTIALFAASAFTPLPYLVPTLERRSAVLKPSAVHTRHVGVRAQGGSQPGFIEKLKVSFRLFQESRAAGYNFKQAVADGIAGEYDVSAVTSAVTKEAASAPVVLFTWESSPACKKALKYLEWANVKPHVVRLDNPWSEGNPKRAALGRLTGRSSVPSIWIGGKYVGGCDDGPSDEAPGLVKLAFDGSLPKKLEAAGVAI
jgi:glutaredoxin